MSTDFGHEDPPVIKKRPRKLGKEACTYPYEDESGTVLFETVRFEPKDFRQRQPDGTWGMDGVRRVPFHLPQILAADPDKVVWVVDGEKDVLRLEALGEVATCAPMGMSHWEDAYSAHLRGRNVVVVEDQEDVGPKAARRVSASLRRASAACCIVHAASGKDVSDHLDAGLSLDDLVDGEEGVRFERSDIADMMVNGIPEVTYALRDLLPDGHRGRLSGPPGLGKSLLILAAVAAEMKADPSYRCVWWDQENGEETTVERLLALGVTPEVVEQQFFYFAFADPRMQDRDDLELLYRDVRPRIVVHDSQVDLLGLDGFKENDADDVRAWARVHLGVPFRLGIADLVIDHTPWEAARTRGSSDKDGVVEVVWVGRKTEDYDERLIGEVEFVNKKRRRGRLPTKIKFTVGGTPFRFDRKIVAADDEAEDVDARRLRANMAKVRDCLKKHGTVESKNALQNLLGGNRNQMSAAIDEAVASPEFEVTAEPGGRSGSTRYRYTGQEAVQ